MSGTAFDCSSPITIERMSAWAMKPTGRSTHQERERETD